MATSEKTFNKIDIACKASIGETIAIGQILRNKGGRIFEIENLDLNQIVLKPLNPEKGKQGQILTMGRKTFVDLYFLKNYTQVYNLTNARKETMDASVTGGDRFLL